MSLFSNPVLYMASRYCNDADYKEKIGASSGNFYHPSYPSGNLSRLPGKWPSAVRTAADGLYALTVDMVETRVQAAAIEAAAHCQVN